MLKIGLIGCGKIADSHVTQIQNIPDCELISVCDKELLMAKQLSERFNVKNYFDDVNKMLALTQPDIIHITTAPQSHFALAKLCLEAGCHVYVEKPFTVNTQEAEHLIQFANSKKLKLTVGHNTLFNHAARRMRELIKNGYLGGDPIHMESIYNYSLGNPQAAGAFLDRNHWVRELPGKLLHNLISHGVSKVVEFLDGDSAKVIAKGFTSSFLAKLNASDIIDELRVIIYDNNNLSAYFTFSTQISPVIHSFCIYGPQNSIVVDHIHQTVIKINNRTYKSFLNQFIPPYLYGRQYKANAWYNLKKFLGRNFPDPTHEGMKYLISSFYRSVLDDKPLPISYREILLTSKIMDDIFEQITKN